MFLILKGNPVHLINAILTLSITVLFISLCISYSKTNYIYHLAQVYDLVFLVVVLTPREPKEGLMGDCSRFSAGVLSISKLCPENHLPGSLPGNLQNSSDLRSLSFFCSVQALN